MTRIKWNDKHSVGIKVIDKQHQHFISLLNKLYDCLESNNFSDLTEIIDDLTTYTDYHFKTEEEYFDKFQYEDSAAHKAVHEELRKKVKSFTNKQGDPSKIGFDLLYLLERWFLLHLDGMDKKYTQCFKQHGLS